MEEICSVDILNKKDAIVKMQDLKIGLTLSPEKVTGCLACRKHPIIPIQKLSKVL